MLKIIILILFVLESVSFAQYIPQIIIEPQSNRLDNETNEIEANEIIETIETIETEDEEIITEEIEQTEEINNEPIDFSQNFIMDYNLIDIMPIIEPETNLLTAVSNENYFENGIESHRHSIGIDFGTTIFATLTAPSLINFALSQPKNSPKQTLEGKFGFRLTYTYRILEKLDLDAAFGMYFMDSYYSNSSSSYSGGVYGIPFSLGLRFYFNKKDRASGFFLNPKIGATVLAMKGTEYKENEEIKKNSVLFDFYVSSEIGFRIDLSRSLGIDKGVRPFIDISILDIGVSYSYILRLIPLPRFAIGILF